MKNFTVKDFIDYNNPCMNCGINISLELRVVNHHSNQETTFKPSIENGELKFNLLIKYNSSLYLKIFHTSNKFETNDEEYFSKYLETHSLTLRNCCSRCDSIFRSSILDFTKNFIKPFQINFEKIVVYDEGATYTLLAVPVNNKSFLTIFNKQGKYSELALPFLNRAMFKDKIHFMKKIKTYLIFS